MQFIEPSALANDVAYAPQSEQPMVKLARSSGVAHPGLWVNRPNVLATALIERVDHSQHFRRQEFQCGPIDTIWKTIQAFSQSTCHGAKVVGSPAKNDGIANCFLVGIGLKSGN